MSPTLGNESWTGGWRKSLGFRGHQTYNLILLISITYPNLNLSFERAARDISNPENREIQSRAARDASLERPKNMKILTETSKRQANQTITDNVQCTMSIYVIHLQGYTGEKSFALWVKYCPS